MSAYLSTAKNRLNEFMEKHSVSVKEMNQLLGLRPGAVEKVLNDIPGASIYGERIVVDMVADEPLILKLNEMRGIKPEKTPEPVKQEAVEKKEEKAPADASSEAKQKEESIQDEAIRMANALKEELKIGWAEICEKLGYKSKTAVPSMISHYKAGNLGTRQAQGLLGAINNYRDSLGVCLSSQPDKEEIEDMQHDGLDANEPAITAEAENKEAAQKPVSQDSEISTAAESETTHESDIQEDELSPEDSQAEADIYGAQFEELPEVTCIGCGCTDSRECEDGCTWIAMNTRNQTGVCTCCEGEMKRWQAMQGGDDISAQLSHINGTLAAIKIMGHILAPIRQEEIQKAARALLEESLGIDHDGVIALKPQIELLAVCKRNGIGCHVVPDSVSVQ